MEYNGERFIERMMKIANCKKKNELAEKLKVDKSYISKWIKAKTFPSVETLIRIASTLNCSMDYLLGIEKKEVSHYTDIRDLIGELFLYDYIHHLERTPQHYTTGFSSFEYLGIETHKNTIAFHYSSEEYPFDASRQNTAINELLDKLSAISKFYNSLDKDQVILLIENEIKKSKEKYSAVEYV